MRELTQREVLEDAKSLVLDLVTSIKGSPLTCDQEMQALLEASKVLATASRILAAMITDERNRVIH